MVLAQDKPDPKLALLTRLVSDRQLFLSDATVRSGSTKRFLKRLARRRAIESQKLVSTLMSDGVSNLEIEEAINLGMPAVQS